MAAAGCQLLADLTELAVMWFLRVVLNLHRFWSFYRSARLYFRDQRPDAVVLIDYPGFNWWIARAAKRYEIPVFYYGVPQMWAWAPWRVRKMRRSGGSRLVQTAVRGPLVSAARLPGDVCRASVFRSAGRTDAGPGFSE
jgi:hypothetical protein